MINRGSSARAHLYTMNKLITSRIAIALIAFGTGTLTTAFLLRHSGYGENPIVSSLEVPSLSEIYLKTVKKSVTGTSVACDVFSLICIECLRACVINKQNATYSEPPNQSRIWLRIRYCRYSSEDSGLWLRRRPRGRSDSEAFQFEGVDT